VLRAAVIGLGVGERHLAGYAAHPQCEPVAICDIDRARLEEAAQRYPGVRTTTDPDEILTAPDVDVVSVSSYDSAHFAQIVAGLRADKHVFAEKPMVVDEEQAREVRRLLTDRPHLRLSTNVPLRHSPRFAELRERIRAGELGTLFHAEGDYEYGRRHKLTDGWRGLVEPAYSVVLGGGIHIVDLLLWLTGERPETVRAAVGSGIATRGTAFAPDDFVLAILTCPSGMTWKVTANLGCVSPHFHRLRLYGTDGTFVNAMGDGALHTAAGSEAVATPYPVSDEGGLIGPFVDSVLGVASPAVSADEAFAALSVCFAIERARRSGRAEAIEWL
jgi:predicted dehydrogenase